VSTAGLWAPFPYICEDTSHALELSISRLGELIRKFGTANPNTRFVIIGHSQGGLIALQGARLLNRPDIIIDAVITLDGALGGAPRLATDIADAVTCWGDPATNDLTRIWNSTDNHADQGTYARFLGQDNETTVRLLQSRRTRIFTVGSNNDAQFLAVCSSIETCSRAED
jgi:pimeloyl-ACP methyl ester carboxylesterase